MSTATLEPIRDVLAFEHEKHLHPAEYRDMALTCEIGLRAFDARRCGMSDSIETRVARGVALLDEKVCDWVQRINLDFLNIEACEDCILGQLGDEGVEYTAFEDAAVALIGADAFQYNSNAQSLIDHGFSDHRGGGIGAFNALTAEWKRVILARRGGAS
jgi:hypothetical protein